VSALAQQTITDLHRRDVSLVGNAILTAAAFFELASGHPQPADPAATDHPATPEQLTALRDALIGVVNDPLDLNTEGAALWALGKSSDGTLVPFFVRWLVAHRTRNPFAAQQALIGLNNHGEPTLSLEGQLSATDPDLTLRQADAYLREIHAI
jgi:hypothetical protein